jgi:hypothetical protein
MVAAAPALPPPTHAAHHHLRNPDLLHVGHRITLRCSEGASAAPATGKTTAKAEKSVLARRSRL